MRNVVSWWVGRVLASIKLLTQRRVLTSESQPLQAVAAAPHQSPSKISPHVPFSCLLWSLLSSSALWQAQTQLRLPLQLPCASRVTLRESTSGSSWTLLDNPKADLLGALNSSRTENPFNLSKIYCGVVMKICVIIANLEFKLQRGAKLYNKHEMVGEVKTKGLAS